MATKKKTQTATDPRERQALERNRQALHLVKEELRTNKARIGTLERQQERTQTQHQSALHDLQAQLTAAQQQTREARIAFLETGTKELLSLLGLTDFPAPEPRLAATDSAPPSAPEISPVAASA